MTQRFELWCRTACVGGKVDESSARNDAAKLRGQRHLLFAIHGYNDTACEASQAYDKFCARQSALVTAGQDWTFGTPMVEVHWPGDADWGFLRALYYPEALKAADQTAALLSNIIRDLLTYAGGELTVDFVTHSMGARVALGAISALRGTQGLLIRRCVHMAAAVPVRRLEAATDVLRLGLLEEMRLGKSASFHSSGDDVLAYAFPAGESLDAHQEGFMPVALGHREWVALPTLSNLKQFDASPAGHGDYWGGVDELENEVRTSLEFTVAGSAVPPTRNASPPRAIDTRAAETRDMPARATGAPNLNCACH